VCVCAACDTIYSSFGGLSAQQVALWCMKVCVCECVYGFDCVCVSVMRVVLVWSRFGGVSVLQVALACVSVCVCECVCCVWDSLEEAWGIERAAGGFVVCV